MMTWETGKVLPPWHGTVSLQDVVRYAGASGDFNPIHYDDAVARRHGLPGVIVHGMFNMGVIARYVETVAPNNANLITFSARFRSMVEPGQTYTITAKVDSQIEREGSKQEVVLGLALTVDGNRPAITAKATLLIP